MAGVPERPTQRHRVRLACSQLVTEMPIQQRRRLDAIVLPATGIAVMLRHMDGDKIKLNPPLPDEWFAKSMLLGATVLLDAVAALPSLAHGHDEATNSLLDEALEHYEHLPLVDKIAKP